SSRVQPTASGLLATANGYGNSTLCVFCNEDHKGNQLQASKMSNEEQIRFLQKKGCCFACFGTGHNSRRCFRKPKCTKCMKFGHYSLMCRSAEASAASGSTTTGGDTSNLVMST